jgi:hypothetical protein
MKIRKYKLYNILTTECYVVDNIIQAARITQVGCGYLKKISKLGTASKRGWTIKEVDINGEE